MDSSAKPYTSRRWSPPPMDDVSQGRFDDEATIETIHVRQSPALVWFGDKPPEPPPMLVRDLLPQGQIAIAAGVFSSGKTFVVGDLAACVMLDIPFAGREVIRPGGVLWLAAEGANEIDARIKAAAQAHSDDETPALPFARQAFDVPKLTGPDAEAQITALAEAFQTGLSQRFAGTDLVMIVIDTLGSAAGFVDGNSSAEAQRVMDMLRRVNVATGALILLVDHFGKAVETGVMGASAKAQSADAVLGILADKTIEGEISNRRMTVAKLRGGAGGLVTPFKLRQVPVGGFGGTTCVVDWETMADAFTPGSKAKKERPAWSGNGRVLKSALERALIDHGKPMRPFADGPEVKAVPLRLVRTEFYASYAADTTEAKKKVMRRQLDSAIARQLVGTREIAGTDHLWLISNELESQEGHHGDGDRPL